MMALAVLTSAIISRPQRPPLSRGDQAAAFFSMMRMNVRRTFGVWVVLATAALAVFFVSRFATTEVVLWSDWSTYAARGFIVVGPVFAVWSAMLAQRDAKPNRVDLLAATATSRIRRELGLAVIGMVGALVCYGIVVATVLGFAATRATWGGPDVWIVLFGGAASVTFALAGWLAGTLIPGRSTPILAGGGLFVYIAVSLVQAPQASGRDALLPGRYLAGGWDISTRLFYELPPYAGRPHPGGGVLLALGIGAALVAGYLRMRGMLRPSLIALAAGAVLLAPGWVIATERGQVERLLIADPAMSCAGEAVTVCLHQAHDAQLEDAVAFADAFHAPLIGIAAVPEVITQQPYRDTPPAGTLSFDTYTTSTPIETVLVRQMGHALMGGEFEPLNASQNAILTWLAEQAGGEWSIEPVAEEIDPMTQDTGAYQRYEADVDAAADRFAALSPEEQQAWLGANWDALRSGELTLEDVP